jgi:hypothetical protein
MKQATPCAAMDLQHIKHLLPADHRRLLVTGVSSGLTTYRPLTVLELKLVIYHLLEIPHSTMLLLLLMLPEHWCFVK